MMKKRFGLTIKLIPSEAEFYNLAVKFNVLMYLTLVLLWATREEWGTSLEFLDLNNFEMSKVTFRGTMRLFASMMAPTYWSHLIQCVLSALVFKPVDDSAERIRLEMATLYGFLTLVLFLLNLFGLSGLAYLLITPPVLLLVFRFAKSNKESQDQST